MATVSKRSRLAVWKDVIFALFIRTIRSQFNDKFGLSWAVVNPVSFILILSVIRGRLEGGTTHTLDTFTFMACGMLTVQMFLSALGASAGVIKKNKALFAFRQVRPISAFIASGLFELLVKVLVLLSVVLAMYFLKIDILLANPLLFIIAQLAIFITAGAIGAMFAIATAFIPEIDKIRGMLTRPLFFISGVFFSLQDLPRDIWIYFQWNPILHAIELSRQAVSPSFGAVGVSLNFLLGCALVSLFISLCCYQVYWKRAISN
ncbi:ABC transporter permease [Agarivorans aestuarii]|uniref:Transport permease protein n=1 Tax=Agarivorans aestuarii TaxID=1563703 RepID=A0ABU7G051_9ALTE|nr:ABC transporter permease [Agarivorans aestuarii]MEE1672802.1 ABC transporter permease [Agarivorans aestuarii]